MPIGGCLQIEYTGAEASCLLVADATAKTLSSKIGSAGAEAPDPAFGAAGMIDLTEASADSLEELAALIDGYADYSASILYGDDIPTEAVLDQIVQAKGTAGYLLFNLTSVLSPYALTTWARVREAQVHLKDSDQLFVERLINAATELGEAIAGRRFKARSYQRDLDGMGRDRLILPDLPVLSVAHVYMDALGLFGSETEITDTVLYGEAGILARRAGLFPGGLQNVRVQYTAGMDPVDERLQFAAIEVVAWNLQRFRGAGGVGLRSAKVDDWDYSYEITIPLSAQRVFESYRSGA